MYLLHYYTYVLYIYLYTSDYILHIHINNQMPGTDLTFLYILTHLILPGNLCDRQYYSLHFRDEVLRVRNVKQLAQVHTTRRLWFHWQGPIFPAHTLHCCASLPVQYKLAFHETLAIATPVRLSSKLSLPSTTNLTVWQFSISLVWNLQPLQSSYLVSELQHICPILNCTAFYHSQNIFKY